MLVRSDEKLMCHTSARSYVVISTKWILIDTGRSKYIQKNRKFGWTIRIQHWPDKQGS